MTTTNSRIAELEAENADLSSTMCELNRNCSSPITSDCGYIGKHLRGCIDHHHQQGDTMNTATKTINVINVSRKFCEDHEERDCEMPVVVKTMKNLVTIEVDPDHPGWKDLKSDADYYGSWTSEECWYDPSFPATARAVKAKMLAAEAALAVLS